MVNFWKKKIKDTNTIANKVGVDEEKIKELVKGERQIEGKTMEKVLDAINENKIDGSIKNMEILQWYKDADIKKLREKFGYNSQSEFARKLGYDVSVICRIENKKDYSFKNGIPASLKKIYFFFQDDFNRKTEKKKIEFVSQEKNTLQDVKKIEKWYKETDIKSLRCNSTLKKKAKQIGIPASSLNDIEHKKANRLTSNIIKVYNYYNNVNIAVNKNLIADIKKQEKEILQWYKKTNIKELRKNMGLTQFEVANIIGMSQPCVGDVENKITKSVSPTLRQLYKFYNDSNVIEKVIDTTNNEDDEIMKWYKSIEDFGEYRRKFGYSKNKFMAVLNLSNDQIREFERHNYKSTTSIVKKIYEFYHDEKNRQPEIEWMPSDNNTWVKGKLSIVPNNEELQAVIMPQNDNKYIEEIAKLKEENEKLKKQVARYEKLIDRM